MRTRKTFVTLTLCILLALIIAVALNLRLVAAQPIGKTNLSKCSRFVTGAYLTTISDVNGNFASRGVITLTQDGNLFVIDSNQGGVKGSFNPFGDTQGAYNCTTNREITAAGINFGFSGDFGVNDIARSDIHASFSQDTQTVQGTITILSFALKANPLLDEGSVVGTFPFIGQRINYPR